MTDDLDSLGEALHLMQEDITDDILRELKFWANAAYPTSAITDGCLKDMLMTAAAEIERLRSR